MSKQLTSLHPDAIALICSLIRESHSVSEGISDTSVATNSTYSSKFIEEKLSSLSTEDRKYVDEVVGNLNRLVTEVVDTIPTADTAKSNTLYLYKASDDTGSSYEQYMLINGAIVTLGTTEVNLDNYYNKQSADDKFATKTDLSGTTDTIGDVTTLATDSKILTEAINEVKEEVDNIQLHVEISAEDYNALDESVQNDGTMWLIPDMVTVGEDMIIDSEPKEGSGNLISSGGVYNTLPKALWTNPDISVEFASQDISLDSTDYDYLTIVYASSTTSSNIFASSFIEKGEGIITTIPVSNNTSNNGGRRYRASAISDDGKTISFSDCNSQTNGSNPTVTNLYFIPKRVIGHKYANS